MRWENNIYGMLTEADRLDMGFNVTRQSDPIDGLFGDRKTDNLFAEWESIAGEYQVPMMAQFHGFDTEAQKTFRIPIDNHNIEKGLIKVKINQSERMRALEKSGVNRDSQKMYEYVLNDSVRLAEQVFTRTKVAKNEVMATGAMTIKENNLDLTIDYGVPAANKGFTLDLARTADIGAVIQSIIDRATAVGVTITGMMTSRKNVTKMRNNAGLQTAVNGNVGSGAIIKSQSLKDYLNEEYGIEQIIINDLTYGASASMDSNGRPLITQKRYYPDNKITFFATNAAGQMGIGLWGDPPEVDIANLGASVRTESGVSPYVYITQYAEKDPAVIWTKASALFVPVLYNPNSLIIADVTDSTT